MPGIRLAAVLLFTFLSGLACARADDQNPLRPADMSSPRATLEGFVASMDKAYAVSSALLSSYAASGRLYLSVEERERLALVRAQAITAVRSLDTSRISPAVKTIVAPERAIQLKEILDRIAIPPFEAIPDHAAMAATSAKSWRIPETEIEFVLIEQGPRAGDYLVSADTVDRLPEFYERVKQLPYLPGPAKQLSDVYRGLSGNGTATIFEIISNSPAGLDRIVPTRWMVGLPAWLKARVADLAVWQWFGLAFGLVVSALFVFAAYRIAHRFARDRDNEKGWDSLLTPIAIVLVAHFVLPLLALVLRIGGRPAEALAFVETVAVYASAAWVFLIGSGVLGETIAGWEHLVQQSLDSQLVLLGTRFVGIVIAVALLLQAATELGFPAYSVLAGLGIGGLAFALAARDSLANLLGSVLIMFEKPFRLGHTIRVSGSEGVVEQVGFRSTRIRTFDNALISIPNNIVVNATVENLSLRKSFRQRLALQLRYDTSLEKIEGLVSGIRQLLRDRTPAVRDNFAVNFNDLGDNSLRINVVFHLEVENGAEEAQEREQILYAIMNIAKNIGVIFAAEPALAPPHEDVPREKPRRAAAGSKRRAPRARAGATAI